MSESGLNLDRNPSFFCSDQARLKSRLLSYAFCSVFSQSSFFHDTDLQVLQNVHAFIFVEPSYLSYIISYTNGMIVVQNEWHIFIHPSCTPRFLCVPCTVF